MIRFARVDDLSRTQAERPELVLVNSHDRSSAYQLHAGIFRFVCSNGMILADSVFARISIMHVNFEPAKVIEASFEVVREMPRIADLSGRLQGPDLDHDRAPRLWRGCLAPQIRQPGESTHRRREAVWPTAAARTPRRRSGTPSTWCRKT